ncbi:hypothetical protein HAPAU_04690 [Halalkalicoccus paucihalophilus]|uniref:PGF-CTERM sorting domain-containing protein n=2 Tax=Halalkalicoccus paucihalophilus TaxID=1008153 RepID=A0A151AJF5_9EURY|nr:hypothetical protein HAPAU_04690 [Halalkalicoccus paucihalophilus]
MVLSVFAMSAAFAGAAAADATEVTAENVDLADGSEATINVSHADGDGEVYAVISQDGTYNEGDDILVNETGNVDDQSTELNADVSGLDGEYTVYAIATDGTLDAPAEGDDLTQWSQADTTFTVSDSRDAGNLGSQEDFYQGQSIEVTGFEGGETVAIHAGTSPSDSPVEYLRADSTGMVTIDTTDYSEGPYVLVDDEDTAYGPFWVVEQDISAEFVSDTVDQSETTLNYDSDNRDEPVNLQISSDDLSDDDLEAVFGGTAEDGEVTVEDVDPNGEGVSADFSDIETGEYNVTVSVEDTTAETTTSVEVTEEVEANAEFDSSTYSEEAGDIVEFTVDLQGTDNATVDLTEGDENYNASINVVDNDGDGEVTVYFNTYNAGKEAEDTFYTADDSEDTVSLNGAFDGEGEEKLGDEYRLLPADFNLELYVNSEETDLATLVLNDGSTGDIDTAVAPAGADISSDVDDLENATTTGSDVADGDQLVIGVDVSGVFGQLANDDFDSSDLNLTVEQSNPERYTSANTIENFDVVTDADNNRIYFVVDTTNENIDADQEYDVTFSVSEDYVNSYSESNDNNAEEAETSFSVTERNIEVTGDFNADGVLQVENDENATVTGESNAAPGTDVQIRLRATGDDPFLMSQTAEVGDEGAIESTFDLSEHEAGQNFTVRMTDNNGEEEVQQQVDATLVESAGQPHTVTITVEDADGNAVSGADVSVADQTETTGDDGQVTFELWHGEYDVTATHDGEETTGTLTINDEDDTTDEGTLVLGEENQNINDGDEQNQDDNNNDEKNGDDNNNDGSGDDSEGEDQPGFGIAVALIALLAAAGIALRNRA